MHYLLQQAKKWKSQIAMFVLLLAALLSAYLLAISRSAVSLSKPIKLDYAGLSVSMPVGGNWKSQRQWEYRQNGFSLISHSSYAGGRTGALAKCRYLLASLKIPLDEQFAGKALEYGCEITETNRIRTGKLTIDYAHITKPQTEFEIFFGIGHLQNKHQFNIEVHRAGGNINPAGLFKRIIESFTFEQNSHIQAGIDTIAEIKTNGVDKFLPSNNLQSFFVIKNSKDNVVGFFKEVLVGSNSQGSLNIEAENLLYIREPYPQRQVSFFRSNNKLSRFIWKSESTTPAGSRGTDITLADDGSLTVTRLTVPPEEVKYEPGSAAIPEVFLDILFARMLEGDKQKISVEIIEADSKITPVSIYKTESPRTKASLEEDGYVLRMELHNDSGFSEKVYFDKSKQITKRLLALSGKTRSFWKSGRDRQVFTIERTTAEDLAAQFPKQADLILKKNNVLQEN